MRHREEPQQCCGGQAAPPFQVGHASCGSGTHCHCCSSSKDRPGWNLAECLGPNDVHERDPFQEHKEKNIYFIFYFLPVNCLCSNTRRASHCKAHLFPKCLRLVSLQESTRRGEETGERRQVPARCPPGQWRCSRAPWLSGAFSFAREAASGAPLCACPACFRAGHIALGRLLGAGRRAARGTGSGRGLGVNGVASGGEVPCRHALSSPCWILRPDSC